MAIAWEIVERLTRTRFGKTERQYLFKRFGKVIRRSWRVVREVSEQEAAKLAAATILMAGKLAERAAQLYPKFAKRYPFVAALTEQEWAEAVARLINRGEKENIKGIRGVIVERFIPTMKQMTKLYDEMVVLAKKNGFDVPALISGARTLDGKELADWMIISQHPDGRVWIMAIVESKSISNTVDLVFHGDKPVGQHLWDIWRAKSIGFKFEKVHKGGITTTNVKPGRIVAGRPGSNEPTRLIAVAPRDFTPAEIKKLTVKGLPLPEHWDWPVDQHDLLKMLNELMDALAE
jgi:hypothetical protein